MLEPNETIIRFVAAVLYGLVIGFTRKHKPPGMRTFALLALGCCMFTIIGISLSAPNVDQTRIIGQIISGVGFLGLGVIWKQGEEKPAGLTTASLVWTASAIGVLVGLGMWLEVSVGTFLAVIIVGSKKQLQKVNWEDS